MVRSGYPKHVEKMVEKDKIENKELILSIPGKGIRQKKIGEHSQGWRRLASYSETSHAKGI